MILRKDDRFYNWTWFRQYQDYNLLREENIKLRAKNDVLRELAGLKRKEE